MTDEFDECNCDLNCDCVDPGTWWPSPSSCTLVVDPEFSVNLAGTVYAQARECQSTTPASVIDIDDPWVIDVHITLDKIPYGTCGLWCVSACLESMCGPTYYRFPHDSTPTQYCCCLVETTLATEYEITICIPGDIVKENECGAPYELTVIVTLLDENLIRPDGDICDPGNHTPLGVACACELPLMTFYDGG